MQKIVINKVNYLFTFTTIRKNNYKKIEKFIDKSNTSCYDVLNREKVMDTQLKRGILDVCVLSAIKLEESYGYKIIKDLKPYVELSESTLYTILKRLETLKMLTVRSTEHLGRVRKYYKITRIGLNRLKEFENEWREIMNIYTFVSRGDKDD